MFLGFADWLTEEVGPAKAAIVQNKTFDFFTALEDAPNSWADNVDFLASLDGGYFRKSSLLKRYLDFRDISLDANVLKDAMDLRTVFKNMDTTLTLCPDEHQSVVSEFFNKRIDEYRRELIKSQTLRIESSSIRRLYENFVRFSDLNIAIIQLAAEAPGLECSLTAYLNFTEAIIQLSWPSLAISTQYRLAYLINKFRRCPLRDAELCEFVRCFLLHFYGESVAKGSFSIRTEDNELIVLANRKDFWVASPSREH